MRSVENFEAVSSRSTSYFRSCNSKRREVAILSLDEGVIEFIRQSSRATSDKTSFLRKKDIFVALFTGICVVPVSRSGEHSQNYVPAVHPDDGAGGVEQVKVEVGIPGDGAVQTGLQEGRPLLLQDTL